MNRLPLRVIALACALTGALRAQCPDGSPPPCRTTTSARVASPALNERAWIVVPFTNVTHAADLDWLRDASVNLLTLEVGRWADVQVVNDKRVGDLVNELPAARRTAALTLNDGLALARRAGAGKLVMGDYYKLGAATRLVANVFDVKSGSRVRSVEQRAPQPDSLLNAFGPLAREVLALPPPADARMGEIGTTHLDAYQEYLAGVRALGRFNLDEAERRFAKALTLDSTFALAHLGIANALGWREGNHADASDNARVHAIAAQRLGARLPPRERAIIASVVATTNGDYAAACAAIAPVVARDSSDAQALYQLGECAYHDGTVVLAPGDTTRGRFLASWNVALRSLETALRLDPANHQAFQHIVDILRAPSRLACSPRSPVGGCTRIVGIVRIDHDTLVTLATQPGSNAWFRFRDSSILERPLVANLQRAARIAGDWVAADTTSVRARWGYANVLMGLGDLTGAYAQLQRVPVAITVDDIDKIRMHMDLAIKLGRSAEARAWFDSAVKAVPDQPATVVPRGSIELAFGRTRRVTNGLVAAAGPDPAAQAYARLLPRVMLGLPVENVGQIETLYLASMRDTETCALPCRTRRLMPTLGYALTSPRTTWPTFAASYSDSRELIAPAFAKGDTAQVRRWSVYLDSAGRANVQALWQENGWLGIAAEGYLALRDSAKALRVARFFVDTAMALSPLGIQFSNANNMTFAVFWPRMILLRANLAAALGYPDEAKKWYDWMLDFWSTADEQLQPDLARIRAARAKLGSAK